MFSGLSSSTSLGGAYIPGQTGARMWHMLQRDRMTSFTLATSTLATSTLCTCAAVELCLGPAPESQATATMPAAAAPQVHHGLPFPSWRELKKCRITWPIASTIATMSELKRVAYISG